jgi:copper transport protein
LQLSFKNQYFFDLSSPSAFAIMTAIISASFIMCLFAPINVFAHPFYVDSTPKPFQNVAEPPGEVSVIFSEPIELPYSEISVLGPDGEPVDNKDAYNANGQTSSIAVGLQENAPPGIYTVNTKVLSAVDGHVVDNSFTFGVATDVSSGGEASNNNRMGNQLAGPSALQAEKDILSLEESLSRFPGYVGQVIAFGTAFAMIWLWRPFSQIPWLFEMLAPLQVLQSKAATKILIVGVSLILASGIAMIIVQSVSVGATIPEIVSTKFGNVWSIRMIQASALLLLTVNILQRNSKRGKSISTAEISAVLALALSLLVTYSLIAHAAASNQPLAILADFCHSIVASIWIGGVIFLAFAYIAKLASFRMDEITKARVLSILIPRFSTIAVVSLGIILITGPSLLWTLENDLEITLASLYGRVLIAKLSIGLVMVVMGGYHQFLTQKKFGRMLVTEASIASSGKSRITESGEGPKASSRLLKYVNKLNKTLKVEAALGIGLLFMVSLMANMALPSGEFPLYERVITQGSTDLGVTASAATLTDNGSLPSIERFSEVAYLEYGGRIQLIIKPFGIGQNTFEVSYYNNDSSIARYINSSTLKLTQVERGIGPIAVEMLGQSPGVFSADAAFPLAGLWTVQVIGESVRTGSPNMVAIFNIDVKPSLSQLQFSFEEYKTPQPSLPLYPVYDSRRHTIWVGDSMPGSGRIWEFNIESKNYTAHPIGNVSLITSTAFGNDGRIWYLDPTNNIVGNYDPQTNSSEQYTIQTEGVPSAMALDQRQQQYVWLAVSGQLNTIARVSPSTGNLTVYEIPTPNSLPTSLAIDSTGDIWFTESIGKVGQLDPISGNITEYQPSDGEPLNEPNAILLDPRGSNVYISEHEGKAISVLDPALGIFYRFPSPNPRGLPFGMALDDYGNVWFAQHVVDVIGVLDFDRQTISEVQIPTKGSFIQWLVSDDQGRIWFAEQRGSALGSISSILGPPSSITGSGAHTTAEEDRRETTQSRQTEETGRAGGIIGAVLQGQIPDLGFGFADFFGPFILCAVVACAILYSRNVLEVKRRIEEIKS